MDMGLATTFSSVKRGGGAALSPHRALAGARSQAPGSTGHRQDHLRPAVVCAASFLSAHNCRRIYNGKTWASLEGTAPDGRARALCTVSRSSSSFFDLINSRPITEHRCDTFTRPGTKDTLRGTDYMYEKRLLSSVKQGIM